MKIKDEWIEVAKKLQQKDVSEWNRDDLVAIYQMHELVKFVMRMKLVETNDQARIRSYDGLY